MTLQLAVRQVLADLGFERKFDPDQPRDPDGKFGHGPGAPDLQSDGDEDDADSAEQEEYDDLDETNDAVPAAYRNQYGKVVAEQGLSNGIAVSITDKKSLHVADGTEDREVLLEITPWQATSLAGAVDVMSWSDVGQVRKNGATGAVFERLEGDQYAVTWPSGKVSHFDDTEPKWELSEFGSILDQMQGTYTSMFGKNATSLVGEVS